MKFQFDIESKSRRSPAIRVQGDDVHAECRVNSVKSIKLGERKKRHEIYGADHDCEVALEITTTTGETLYIDLVGPSSELIKLCPGEAVTA